MICSPVIPVMIPRLREQMVSAVLPRGPVAYPAWFERILAGRFDPARGAPAGGDAVTLRQRPAVTATPGDRILAGFHRSRGILSSDRNEALPTVGGSPLGGPATSQSASTVEVRAEATGPNSMAAAHARAEVNGKIVEERATATGQPGPPGGSSSFSYAFGSASTSTSVVSSEPRP
jgi:hypothetical protein